MRFFDKIRARSALRRIVKEDMYSVVHRELANGVKRDGLWLKAKVESKGDDVAIEDIYIKLRVQSLVDERNIGNAVITEIQSENQKATHREMLKEREIKDKDEVERLLEAERVAILQLESKGFKVTKYAVGTKNSNWDCQNGELFYKARSLDDLFFYTKQQW
jgi:hypothetical protein